MDGERFDALARIMVIGASRRTLLRGFIGAGLAAVAGVAPAWPEFATAKKRAKRRKKCKNGTVKCADSCVDLASDALNCGVCGLKCASGETCLNGQCPLPACTDTMTDRTNCGACGNLCGDGASCISGICKCALQDVVCDGKCANLLVDTDHCGSCETSCPEGGLCSQGRCACPPDEVICSDECVHLQTNPAHCGECGNACPNQGTCIAGGCVEASQFRLVLRWDDFPRDLDARLYLPEANQRVIHYGNRGDANPENFPYAFLDRDDLDGFGPETITIFRTVEGMYRYAVQNYRSEQCCLASSGATVQLFEGDTLRNEWDIPELPLGVDPTHIRWWHVFDLQSDGTLEDVNQLQEAEPWPYSPPTTGARSLPRKEELTSEGLKRRKSKGKGNSNSNSNSNGKVKNRYKNKNKNENKSKNTKRHGRNHRQRSH